MNASSQPTTSQPRYVTLTVADVRRALADAPADAEIEFADGGRVQARDSAPYLETRVSESIFGVKTVHTCWI